MVLFENVFAIRWVCSSLDQSCCGLLSIPRSDCARLPQFSFFNSQDLSLSNVVGGKQ